MTDNRRLRRRTAAAMLAVLVAMPVVALAQTGARPVAAAVTAPAKGTKVEPAAPPPDAQDKALARYLETARSMPSADPNAWMQGLTLDLRARRVNDILTVRVEETIAATGTADTALGKSTSTGVGISTLFGLQSKIPAGVGLGDLASSQSNTDFSGSGTTARASALTATISARVAEVLPNGDLLVEGVREIEINGDRQVVVLTGVARVVDIGPGNVIPSSVLGQLSIRYFGRGLTKGSLTPGWLVRVLNKVF
ncbi:MAG: flagellar basal body L-ring protein FlgH [Acidobacteria bacterium]|nr:flagellar basal body L-ring protein FlgH [Acidobacteriota bacterium]